MRLVYRQALIVLLGAVVATVMVFLGLWQMRVFIDKGDRTVAARAAQPAIPLLENIHTDGTFGDVYGKQVYVTGEYLPAQEVRLPLADGGSRVLTALRLTDGRVVPVARGRASAEQHVAPPPAGVQTVSGLFLPGEGEAKDAAPGALESVRMPLLAQRWPQQLTPGFITLDEQGAMSQGLAPAPVTLPHGDGAVQNGAYALQWWVFAATALGASIKVAHSLGEKDRRRRDEELIAAGPLPPPDPATFPAANDPTDPSTTATRREDPST